MLGIHEHSVRTQAETYLVSSILGEKEREAKAERRRVAWADPFGTQSYFHEAYATSFVSYQVDKWGICFLKGGLCVYFLKDSLLMSYGI